MARIPKRLAGPLLVTNSVVTRYTCPALTKAIIRKIHVFNNSGTAATFTLSVGADAAGTRYLDAVSIPTLTSVDYWCYLIVDAAEIVQTNAGTTNVLVITLEGDEIVIG